MPTKRNTGAKPAPASTEATPGRVADVDAILARVRARHPGVSSETRLAAIWDQFPDDLKRKFDEIAERSRKLVRSPDGKAWMKLIEILRRSQSDPVIKRSAVVSESLDVFLELANDSLFARNALDVFGPLDGLLPKGEHGAKFIARKPGAGGTVRKWVRRQLKANPDATISILWRSLETNPPRGWQAFDNRHGRYVEHPDGQTTRERLANILSEERKKKPKR